MRRVCLALLVAWAGACSDSKVSPRGLRVPLPDGWVATPGAPGVLQVGPKGRVVVTLERRTAALPTLNALRAAVEVEGAAVTGAAGTPFKSVVRYGKSEAGSGLLAVHILETGVVLLCASTPAAEPAELDSVQALCAGVRLEAAP